MLISLYMYWKKNSDFNITTMLYYFKLHLYNYLQNFTGFTL